MSQAPANEVKEEIDDNTDGGYVAKYIRNSKVRELFKSGEINIRISGDTKVLVWEYLDKAVAKAVEDLINRLPKTTKGENIGKLKRITIMKEDFAPPTAPAQ